VNFTPGEVLFAEIVRSIFIESCHTVSLVNESNFSSQLVIHGAKEDATQVIVVLVPSHFSAILKFNLLEAKAVDSAGLQAKENFKFEISVHLIFIVSTIYKEMTPGWMMTRLFEVKFTAILSDSLICLSKDWVEWLCKDLMEEIPAERGRHDQLHSFYRVFCDCCFIHIDWQGRGK